MYSTIIQLAWSIHAKDQKGIHDPSPNDKGVVGFMITGDTVEECKTKLKTFIEEINAVRRKYEV